MKVVRTLPPLVESLDNIRTWFDSDLGRQLLDAERELVDRMMPNIFGYHLLQIGILPGVQLYEHSTAGHKFVMLPRLDLGMPEAGVVGTSEELPFASGCIDAVVLHHALDFAQSPHQVLREAARVLRPGGKLLIVSFNPASFWGISRRLLRKRRQQPWQAHFIGNGRLHDWLALLEFRNEKTCSGFYRPPLRSQGWMNRLAFMEGWGARYLSQNGAFLVTIACKESLAGTPVGMSWRRRLAFPMAETALRRAGREAARRAEDLKSDVGLRQRSQK